MRGCIMSKRYEVICYVKDTQGGVCRWFFGSREKARDKMTDLLCSLPARYEVELNETE